MEIDGVLPMTLADTAEVCVSFGGRQRRLIDLIDGWCGHVAKLVDDSTSSAEDPWNVHDLVAALHLRDAVQRGIDALDGHRQVVSAVSVSDKLFASITLERADRSLTRVEPDLPTDPWWWRRTPVRGPIADELSDLADM